MKKIIFAVGLMVASLFISSGDVSAYSTGVQNGPGILPGSYVNTPVWSITSSYYQSVDGDEVGVIYSNVGAYALSTNCVSNSSRVLTVLLYEYDVAPNAHDLVKTYKGSFSGRTMNNIWLDATNNTGNIDSAGDPTAELYLSAHVTRYSGDTLSTDNKLFNYNIIVN